jgi:hypothetical protein
MGKKTHVMVNEPEISVRHLADYMSASERKKRSIIGDCKYRPAARMIQHQEAHTFLTTFFINGKMDVSDLTAKAEFIKNKLADDDFDVAVNEANAGYLERVSQILGDVKLPEATLAFAGKLAPSVLNGVKVRFSPPIFLERTKKNKKQRGALMFRYAKGTPLNAEVGAFQSAAIFGLLRDMADKDAEEVEKALCLTVDAYTGLAHLPAGKAASDWLNMKAALTTIAERWPAIKPPPNAIL